MRTMLLAGAVTMALGGTALAQMCASPQGATAQSGMSGCMGMQQAQADDPMADKPAEKPTASGMMCPCCKNMAMMSGMKRDADPKGAPKHDMPMPKQ